LTIISNVYVSFSTEFRKKMLSDLHFWRLRSVNKPNFLNFYKNILRGFYCIYRGMDATWLVSHMWLTHGTVVACTSCLQKYCVHVVYMHMNLTVIGGLKYILNKGGSWLTVCVVRWTGVKNHQIRIKYFESSQCV